MTSRIPRFTLHSLRSILACVLLAGVGCVMPGDAATVVKIGLIAPFEGLGRPLGYAALPAVKAAIADANTSGQLGQYRVALVALNDDLDARGMAAQASALAQDEDVIGVLGLGPDAAAREAAPILLQANIPMLLTAPYADPSNEPRSLCPSFGEIAADLLKEAQRLDPVEVVLAGPQNALAKALVASAPSLAAGPFGSSVPCALPAPESRSLRTGAAGAELPRPAGAVIRQDCTVLFTGDAATAADELVRWRSNGWQGVLLGGPEVARPWLIGRATNAAEGVRAVVCGVSAALPGAGDLTLDNQARLADAGTRAILQALARDIAAHGRPTRSGVSAQLTALALEPALTWLQVQNGRWMPGE